MAFPTTSVLDTFDRADGGLGANWTTGFGDGAPSIISNVVGSGSAGWKGAWYTAASYGPDVEAFYTITASASTLSISVRGDGGGASWNGYVFNCSPVAGANNCTIYKVVAGAATALGANFTQAYTNGDGIGLSAVGTTITAYFSSGGGAYSSVTTRTDSTFSGSGNIGFEVFDAAVRINDFGGGTISAPASGATTMWLTA